MNVKKLKDEQFPKASIDAWKKLAEESLKGKPIEVLSKNTYESIKLKPLYSIGDEGDNSPSQFPGFLDYRRGIDCLGYHQSPWKIAQTIQCRDIEQLKGSLASAFEKGQTAISFEFHEHMTGALESIVGNFYAKYPFSINARLLQFDFIEELLRFSGNSGRKVSGFVGMDPVAILAEHGNLPEKISGIYDRWADLIEKTNRKLPRLKTILADAAPYHNGGANTVQELACGISTGAFHLQELLNRGFHLENILSNIVFKFSAGANFFMEIAKFRAARLLWNKVTEAYGAAAENRKMVIAAETSRLTKTVYDPYVNMLRGGNEAFAAVMGGIQYLHVSPFNEPESEFSPFADRLARNTQLILKEEAQLQNTADPAGGSWYIEHLTNELAEKAWELFLQVEESGSIFEAMKTGWLQKQISEIRDKRLHDINTRKQSVIGTNIYANLADRPLFVSGHSFPGINAAGWKEHVESIPQIRVSEPFEQLRRQSERLAEKSGVKPAVGLICLGTLKEHKARAEFVTGFLAPGGISTVKSQEINSVGHAVSFIQETGLPYYFLCGSNERYKEIGLDLAGEIKKQLPKIKLYLAGLPAEGEENEWLSNGIEDFIHLKSNCLQTLSSLLVEMEVRKNDEKA